ncbi:hypothetical protein DUNSADRAFT_2640 [Dunaliella salina]|uniref:Cytochrome b561 domain-containing protein n=1 Tax=Dunaliella salina TaxID=3046 RepID=A0ABQ7FW20_DUNSA|nr:hypothetical protein DUNSADRAFT_2640 [Dunaliella salina]|eukprot:KAF5826578.1 hypothetical protein DUNSADRAFT_2640 [Dunaliella salina]
MVAGGQYAGPGNLAIPRSLHKAINFLCYFMIVWSLVFPMSWLSGVWGRWGIILGNLVGTIANRPSSWTSTEALTKYKEQTAVTMSHNLPSALWAFLIIIQLSGSIRKTYPRIHRLCGYLHVAVSVVLMAGVAIMQSRKMYFSMHPAVVWYINISATWFLFSLGYAVLAARAHLYRAHRAWMLRHIASGTWVAVQRILIAAVALPLEHVSGIGQPTEWHRQVLFGGASVVAFVGCVLFCEIYLWWGLRKQMKLV